MDRCSPNLARHEKSMKISENRQSNNLVGWKLALVGKHLSISCRRSLNVRFLELFSPPVSVILTRLGVFYFPRRVIATFRTPCRRVSKKSLLLSENFSSKFEEFASQLWKAFGRDYTVPDNLAQFAEEYFQDYKVSQGPDSVDHDKQPVQCLPEPGIINIVSLHLLNNELVSICMDFTVTKKKEGNFIRVKKE